MVLLMSYGGGSISLFWFVVAIVYHFPSLSCVNNDSSDNDSLNKKFFVCKTDACYEAGKALSESINSEANPCENFFEFACGNWVKKHPIPDNRASISNFVLLSEQLEKDIDSVLKSAKNKSRSHSTSVQLAVDLYDECLKLDVINRRGIDPLKKLINQWPITDADLSDSSKNNFGWIIEFAKNLAIFGKSPIIELSAETDANQTNVRKLYIGAPSFGIGRKEFENITKYKKTVTAYRKFMLETARLFSNQDLSQSIQSQLNDVFDFEMRLALASTPIEDKRDANIWYNRMSLKQVSELSSIDVDENENHRFDYTAFLNIILATIGIENRFSDSDIVIVTDKPYLKQVIKVLSKTPSSTILNYLNWMTIKSFLNYLDDRSRLVSFEFQKAQTGIQQQREDWRRCVNQVDNELSFASSRLYLEKFLKQGTKEKATEMIEGIKDSFREIVGQIEWLDEPTRKKAMEKSFHIQDNIVYPEWVFTDQNLDYYYGITDSMLKIESDKYFEGILLLQKIDVAKTFSRLFLPVDIKYEIPMPPAIVNAAYDPTRNSITIPAGILRGTFFDPNRPPNMNYGAIGSVVGHEITHGFDDQGRQFDKNGNLIEWWTEGTLSRFVNRSKCFIEQYGSIYDESAAKNLNGKNTVGENIADNGGIRQAYYAYRKLLTKLSTSKKVEKTSRTSSESEPELYKTSLKDWSQQRLPYLLKYSADQVFFISYANIWCGSRRPEQDAVLIDYDPHSPPKYRINVPLSNFNLFAKAFQCPLGSPMNPKHKCSIW